MPKEKTAVCYLISHGFAARMIFQSGLVKRLRAMGKSIAIIAPDAKDPNLVQNCEKYGVKLYEFTPEKGRVRYLKFRKYLLEDVKNNPALYAKHLRSVESKENSASRKLVDYLSFWLNRFIINIPGGRKLVKAYEKRILKSEAADQLLQEIDPEVVVSTYPVNLPESVLLASAEALQIKRVIHLLSWDNITAKGAFLSLADYYIAWGPIMAGELEEYYQVPKEKIFVTGVAHFDNHIRIKKEPKYQEILQDLGLNPESPYLFFGMSSPYFNPREIDVIEWLAAGIEAGQFGPDLQLIVRPHPQNIQNHGGLADTSWLGRLKKIESTRVKINYPRVTDSKLPWSMKDEDMDILSNILAGCSICLNSTSTISIDGLMLGKPVILTSFDAEEQLPWWQGARRVADYIHYRKFLEHGGVEVVRSFSELAEAIQAYLQNPTKDIEKRQRTLEAECGTCDGRATERITEVLVELSSDQKQITQLETQW